MSVEAMTWVFKNSPAEAGARLVLLALADYAHPDGARAWPRVATLVQHTRMSERAVQYALRKLEAGGLIETTGTSRAGTRIYRILGMGGADLAPGGCNLEQEGVQSATDRGASSCTRSVKGTVDSRSVDKSAAEPLGFDDWLEHHCSVTGSRSMARQGTRARASVARMFANAIGDGYSVEQLQTVSSRVFADEWRRAGGHTGPESVLVPKTIERFLAAPEREEAAMSDHQVQLAGVDLAPKFSEDELAAFRARRQT